MKEIPLEHIDHMKSLDAKTKIFAIKATEL